jgi:hypothetical protein
MKAYIIATGSYCAPVTEELPALKGAVKEATGKAVRRVGRFIQLALIGAGRAATELPVNSGLYVCSSRGDMEITVTVLETIFRQRQLPRPLDFINTVSNAACFYVASTLGIQGPSSFVSQRDMAFETTLRAALLDLQSGACPQALVGAADLVMTPLAQHRERVLLDEDAALAEASYWLQLSAEPVAGSLATLEQTAHCEDLAALSAWLEQQQQLPALLAVGQTADAAELQALPALAACQLWRDDTVPGYFGTLAARTLCRFVAGDEPSLLHINRDRHGRYSVLVLGRA